MQINRESMPQCTLINLTGRLDGSTSPVFDQEIVKRLDADNRRVVIDMSAVDYISSAGLRVVLMAVKRAKSLGGGVWIAALQPSVKEVFEMSGFGKIIPLLGTRDDALAAAGA